MKKILLGVAGLLFVSVVISMCDSNEGESSQNSSTESTEQVTKASSSDNDNAKATTPSSNTKSKVAQPNSTTDNSSMEQNLLTIFQQSFATTGTVRFEKENKFYVITPNDPQFVQDISDIMKGTRGMDEWNQLVRTLQETSSEMQGIVGSGYTIILENPFETGEMILAARDGAIIFDGLTEYMNNQGVPTEY